MSRARTWRLNIARRKVNPIGCRRWQSILVRRQVAVLVAGSTLAAWGAKAATATIPIVFGTGGDPIALGLVASFNRPGGNLTGNAVLYSDLAPKRLQLLRDLIPDAALFGVLADPAFPPTPSMIADLQRAARTLGRELVVVNARTDSDLETAFRTFSQQRVGAVLVLSSTFYNRRMEQLAALAARHARPAIFPYRDYALGMRTEPPVSVPSAPMAMSAITAAAEPPDEPADILSRAQGLRTGRK